MKYDFTSILDRHGHDALAVDALGKLSGFAPEAPEEGFDAIPMWVADMNFPVCPAITDAIIGRASHPAFGYYSPRKEYFDAIIRWQETRHGLEGLIPGYIGYENGVLGGLVSALNVLCPRGDKVLLHSPTYIGFTNTIQNNGYQIIHSPLVQDQDGIWRMDYEDMEEKIRAGNIHTAVFCSPHNPCGRVWERDELEKAYALFRKYDVYVISDEIWSDIILKGHTHIPALSLGGDARRRTVALYAPSKTFNLAGLIGSYHIIYDKWLRDRVRRQSSLCHYNDMNVLSMHALIGAYSPEGMEWVDQLCGVLTGNVRLAVDYFRTHFEGVSLAKPEGTYMLFPDCSQWCRDHHKTLEELESMCWRVGVSLQDGRMFNGPWNLRVNLALPRTRVQEALERLDKYVFNA